MNKESINSNQQMIKIKCLDDQIVEVPLNIAKIIPTINETINSVEMAEGDVFNDQLPLPVDIVILQSVVKYCDYHQRNPNIYEQKMNNSNPRDPIYMVEWDETFMNTLMDKKTHHKNLLKLYEASQYLNVIILRKLVAKQLAKIIYEAADPDAVREEFGLAE